MIVLMLVIENTLVIYAIELCIIIVDVCLGYPFILSHHYVL